MPGKVRTILLGVEVKNAGKLGRCAHDSRHKIVKGQTRFVVKNPGSVGEKGYCAACGEAMVAVARKQLSQLEADLGISPTAAMVYP